MSKQLLILVGVACLIIGFLVYSVGNDKKSGARGNMQEYYGQIAEGQNLQKFGGVIAIAGIGIIVWGATKKRDSTP